MPANWFEVGKQVVCINDMKRFKSNTRFKYWFENVVRIPMVGDVLTVRDVLDYPSYGEWNPFLLFDEIVNPAISYITGCEREITYCSHFFRPVRDTDISIFEAFLKKTDKELERVE